MVTIWPACAARIMLLRRILGVRAAGEARRRIVHEVAAQDGGSPARHRADIIGVGLFILPGERPRPYPRTRAAIRARAWGVACGSTAWMGSGVQGRRGGGDEVQGVDVVVPPAPLDLHGVRSRLQLHLARGLRGEGVSRGGEHPGGLRPVDDQIEPFRSEGGTVADAHVVEAAGSVRDVEHDFGALLLEPGHVATAGKAGPAGHDRGSNQLSGFRFQMDRLRRRRRGRRGQRREGKCECPKSHCVSLHLCRSILGSAACRRGEGAGYTFSMTLGQFPCPNTELHLEHTVVCGQAFRWHLDDEGWWSCLLPVTRNDGGA